MVVFLYKETLKAGFLQGVFTIYHEKSPGQGLSIIREYQHIQLILYMEEKHMKAKSFKRVLALALATAMVLTACGQKETGTSESQKTSEPATTSESVATSESTPASESEAVKEDVKPEDCPVITMYPKDSALFSGLVTGNRADFFAKEGGFQLEVWAYSDEKSNAMLTSGDLPDIMYVGAGGVETLETLIDTGKIINYEDYKEYLPNYFENPYSEYVPEVMDKIREMWSSGTNGLYILPMGLGDSTGLYAQTGTFDRNVVKLKWDVYEQIGAPEITDMWQLLDVAEQMLEAAPTAADGTKMYGTFLDNGQDTTRWGCMYLWNQWHGYDSSINQFFVEANRITGSVTSIFEDDSIYKEGAKWYNEIYKRGLMDPDSISTARTDQAPKLDNGYAMLPSGTLPGWQTKYYEVFVPGTVVYRDFTTETMASVNNCIVINSETEHLEECLAFVNMLADPFAWLNINYGPEGIIWETDGNVLKITDAFADWLKEKGNINFFPMGDGTEWSTWNTAIACNTGTAIPGYVGTNGEELPIVPTSWPDAQLIMNDNDNWNAWKETMGAEDLWDYCEKNDITVYQTSKFDGLSYPVADDTMSLTIATIKDVVVPATWKMVYAESEAEFEEIWDQMVEDAFDLGAQDVIDWVIENYKPIN